MATAGIFSKQHSSKNAQAGNMVKLKIWMDAFYLGQNTVNVYYFLTIITINVKKQHFFAQIFWYFKKKQYLCIVLIKD